MAKKRGVRFRSSRDDDEDEPKRKKKRKKKARSSSRDKDEDRVGRRSRRDRDDRDDDERNPPRERESTQLVRADDVGAIVQRAVTEQVSDLLSQALSRHGLLPGREQDGQKSPPMKFDKPPPSVRRMRFDGQGRVTGVDVEPTEWPPRGERF